MTSLDLNLFTGRGWLPTFPLALFDSKVGVLPIISGHENTCIFIRLNSLVKPIHIMFPWVLHIMQVIIFFLVQRKDMLHKVVNGVTICTRLFNQLATNFTQCFKVFMNAASYLSRLNFDLDTLFQLEGA